MENPFNAQVTQAIKDRDPEAFVNAIRDAAWEDHDPVAQHVMKLSHFTTNEEIESANRLFFAQTNRGNLDYEVSESLKLEGILSIASSLAQIAAKK